MTSINFSYLHSKFFQGANHPFAEEVAKGIKITRIYPDISGPELTRIKKEIIDNISGVYHKTHVEKYSNIALAAQDCLDRCWELIVIDCEKLKIGYAIKYSEFTDTPLETDLYKLKRLLDQCKEMGASRIQDLQLATHGVFVLNLEEAQAIESEGNHRGVIQEQNISSRGPAIISTSIKVVTAAFEWLRKKFS